MKFCDNSQIIQNNYFKNQCRNFCLWYVIYKISGFFKIYQLSSHWPHSSYNSKCWLTFPVTWFARTSIVFLEKAHSTKPSSESVFLPWMQTVLSPANKFCLWAIHCIALPLPSSSSYLPLFRNSTPTFTVFFQFILCDPHLYQEGLSKYAFWSLTLLWCFGWKSFINKEWRGMCFYSIPLRD